MSDAEERAEIYADLAGVQEIAQALGVSTNCVRRWIERRESTGCPAPVRSLAYVHLYSLREWKGWHRLWRITRLRDLRVTSGQTPSRFGFPGTAKR